MLVQKIDSTIAPGKIGRSDQLMGFLAFAVQGRLVKLHITVQ